MVFAVAFSEYHESTMDPRLSHIVTHSTIVATSCQKSVMSLLLRECFNVTQATKAGYNTPKLELQPPCMTFHLHK